MMRVTGASTIIDATSAASSSHARAERLRAVDE
jgi:hypothetical protein